MHHAYIIARRAICQARPLARNVSSKQNTQTPPPDFALPPKKLRALVALYHQSESFITAENLDEAIDRAFAKPSTLRVLLGNRRIDWPSLRLEVKERERLHKFGLPETLDSALRLYEAGFESEERERRVEQAFDALYGTWRTDRPGLELLQDTWEDVEERLKEGQEGQGE